jgi:hypothetical protein
MSTTNVKRKFKDASEIFRFLEIEGKNAVQCLISCCEGARKNKLDHGLTDPWLKPSDRNRTHSHDWEEILAKTLSNVWDGVVHEGGVGEGDIVIVLEDASVVILECKLIGKITHTGETAAKDPNVYHVFCVVNDDLTAGELSYLKMKSGDYSHKSNGSNGRVQIYAHARDRRTVLATWKDKVF